MSTLEKALAGNIVQRRLYVYTTPADKIRPWVTGKRHGLGLIKVGETTRQDVTKRIREQFQTASTIADPFELLLDEPALTTDGRSYRDHDVHRVLAANGVHRVTGEWFEGTVADVRAAMLEIDTGEPQGPSRVEAFGMRPEQQAAVDLTAAFFEANTKDQSASAPHFLWNAKMRFGKTFTAYQLAKKMGWTRILVLTYKPAVKTAWKEDLERHIDFSGWQFKDAETEWDALDESKPIVWFASFQDMLGRGKDGKPKAKNEEAHLVGWDCVVLDEYHFGSWRDGAKDLYDPTESDAALDAGDDFAEDTFPLTVRHFLYLSGTPFRALSEGQFSEDSIFNWTYTDEQREKRNWHDTTPNPYAALPQMSMFTYSLGDVAGAIAEEGEFNEFDLSRFFKAKKVKDSDPESYAFDNPDHVQDWLNFIRGKNVAAQKLELIEGKKTPFPFGDPDLIQSLRHTVWYMSDVAACFAMADLLRTDPFFQDYTVVVAAGIKAGQGAKALGPVEDAITNRPDRTRTITLSCGKLMTGVTVAPWTGIFMLRSTNSPESYFQAAFRVQSPWTRPVVGQPNSEIVKQQCYVFDFDPDRALTQVAEYNLKLTEDGGNGIEERVAEFISFLPIFCFDGGSLDELSPENILDVAHSGVGATMLAKRWRSASLVNVDNATLLKLKNDPELLKTLEQIESFRALTKEMETRLASESRLAKAKKEQGTLTKEQDEEKKENNKWRRELRDKLLKFAARIPVFMYLTDEREKALVDVITHLDTGLFEKVTGLTLNDFNKMSDIGVFHAKNMNSGIYHFRRFEISNIAYAGGHTQDEMIGLWDTVVDQGGTEVVNPSSVDMEQPDIFATASAKEAELDSACSV